jgi:hypothetical protein
MKHLQLGDSGRDVEVWQRFLAQVWAADPASMLTGVFDDATEEGTRAFQERFGVVVTGLVDRETVAKAHTLGLGTIEGLFGGGIGKRTVFVALILLVMVSALSHCMLVPPTGRSYEGVALPASPDKLPDAPRPPACPSWFC